MVRRKESGFTLVEIAIVLVIIGLLVGGVLKGQEFIVQAKIRNVAEDLKNTSAAITGYRDRYRALPGDDAGTGRWSGMTAGDGDGNITGLYLPAKPGDETALLWRHLRAAGFIPGEASNASPPTNAAGGVLGVQTGGLGLNGLIICSANLPARIAEAVDAQLDDGKASTGNIRSQLQTGSNDAASASAPTTNYADNGTNLYLLCMVGG